MKMNEDMDPTRFAAVEEVAYGTQTALENLLALLIEKGYISKQELLDKLDGLAVAEDVEEVGFDADAPRDRDVSE